MTTIDLEDIDLPAPEEDRDATGALLPPLSLRTIEEIWDHRERLAEELRDLAHKKGRLEQELERRARAARPDYAPETAKGSVELAGDRVVLRMTYDKTYDYDRDLIDALPSFVTTNELSANEYGELVRWEPNVNGTVFNKLIQRGAALGVHLAQMRRLKSARPHFEPKERLA